MARIAKLSICVVSSVFSLVTVTGNVGNKVRNHTQNDPVTGNMKETENKINETENEDDDRKEDVLVVVLDELME